MPLRRSAFSIDIDDGKFREFLKSFEKYQSAIEDLPDAWKEIAAASAAPAASFAKMVDDLQKSAESSRRVAGDVERFGNEAERTSRAMTVVEHSWRKVSGHITESTRSLLTWGTVLTATSGLLGLGGLWGIEKLSQTAAGGYRSAQNLGITYGENRAFGTVFQRYFDPQSFLSNVNTGVTTLGSQQNIALRLLGFTDEQLATMDTAQLSAAALPRLQDFARKTNPNLLGNLAHAYGYDSLIDVQGLQNLRNAPSGALEKSLADYNRFVQEESQNSKQVNEAWTNLSVTLQKAEKSITDAFIVGLAGLAGPLESVSKGLSDVITALLASPDLKQWITGVSQGLKDFAGYIHTPEFKQNVESFVSAIGSMASALLGFIKWWTGVDPSKTPGDSSGSTGSQQSELFTGKEKAGIVAGAATGGAIGGAVVGMPGMIVGGAIGGFAGYGMAHPAGPQTMVGPEGQTLYWNPVTTDWDVLPPNEAMIPPRKNGTALTQPVYPPLGSKFRPRTSDPRNLIPYIRSEAIKYGIDPDVAVRVAMSEGLTNFYGDNLTSFGAYHLHTGGGLGDVFKRDTGHNPSNPLYEKETIDWVMRHLKETGWLPYHGAARVGIGNREGIDSFGTKFWNAIMPGAHAAPMSVPKSALPIIDDTKLFGIGHSWGDLNSVHGMIIHHTGGRGSVDAVLNTFRQRGLGSQFVIDRDGSVYQVLPDGARGRHIMPGWGPKGTGLSNANMEGVEIIAKNDRDVTPAEISSAIRLVNERAKRFGYDPHKDVFGHGEVNPGHKDPEEGMSVVRALRDGVNLVGGAALKASEKPRSDATPRHRTPQGARFVVENRTGGSAIISSSALGPA